MLSGSRIDELSSWLNVGMVGSSIGGNSSDPKFGVVRESDGVERRFGTSNGLILGIDKEVAGVDGRLGSSSARKNGPEMVDRLGRSSDLKEDVPREGNFSGSEDRGLGLDLSSSRMKSSRVLIS